MHSHCLYLFGGEDGLQLLFCVPLLLVDLRRQLARSRIVSTVFTAMARPSHCEMVVLS
jgi:hypothetical protein